MADESTGAASTESQASAPSAAKTPPAAPTPTPRESDSDVERYDRNTWKEHAQSRFDVSEHAVHGALHDASPDDTFTEKEVRDRLGFLEERVK